MSNRTKPNDADKIENPAVDGRPATEPGTASDVVGSSGHIPRLEEIEPSALNEHSGSDGADADRRAAEK